MGATVMDQVDRLRAALADRYTLDREIGRGGMAYVYRAHDRQHDRDVAIKVLKPELAAALGTERFLREIHIEARLQHPHILPLYDSGVADGFLYYVMPYVEGESLRDLIRREKQLPLADALQITREVAEALSYAHAHDVLHRDIKPGNILLSGEHAVVADFGIAKAISEVGQDSLTGSGIAVGTPEYMSPEQGTGDGTADRRSDIYALGCVLYEMLAGEPPFSGRSAQTILARHRQDAPPPLHSIRPGLPAAVEASVERALAKVPADRFPTATAFAASLTSGMEVAERPGRWRHRRLPLRLGMAAVLLAALVIAAILTRAPERHPGTAVGVVVIPFDRTTRGGDSSLAGASLGHLLFAEALEWVPGLRAIDGSRLLSAGGSARAIQLSELLRGAQRLGGKYLVTGAILPAVNGSRVSVDVYAVSDGERVVKEVEGTQGRGLGDPVGLLALQSIRALAEREHLDLGARKAMFSSTSSAPALGQLLQGQAKFWRGDFDGAVAAFAGAVEADSLCGLAYLRLSEVEGWRWDYPAALSIVESGLRLRDRLPAHWVSLLEARRQFVLGDGDSAVAMFQNVVLNDGEDIDAWLGLGEALFHFAGFTGHSPLNAQSALERTVRLDSAFVPIYDHLVDLALYQGDSARAAKYVRRMLPDDPRRLVREDAIVLRFGGGAARREAQRRLRHADRQALSEVITLWMHGLANLPLADTLASYLTGPDRTPADRRRGAQYRMVALAGQGHWPEALAVWKSEAGDQSFDAWIVDAFLAGYPAADVAVPMLRWTRSRIALGQIPDFNRPLDEVQQGFEALAHWATLAGDSAGVVDLLRRIRVAPRATDPSDPTAVSLQASLEARLALLGGDSAMAIALLRQSLARINEPYTWYFPLTSMAPQRRLLAELLDARGGQAEAKRWRDSFHNSWSIGDVLFAARSEPAEPRATR